MVNQFVQPGKVIDYTNDTGSDIASKAPVVLKTGTDGACGVAEHAIKDTEEGAVAIEGIFQLPAESADAWAIGDKLYLHATNKTLTDTSTGNDYIGKAPAAKVATETEALVKLAGLIG